MYGMFSKVQTLTVPSFEDLKSRHSMELPELFQELPSSTPRFCLNLRNGKLAV